MSGGALTSSSRARSSSDSWRSTAARLSASCPSARAPLTTVETPGGGGGGSAVDDPRRRGAVHGGVEAARGRDAKGCAAMDEVIHDIAVIPGDGIGNEVVPAAQRVLEAAGARHGFGFRWTDYDWGCERYLETGAMMPDDGLDRLGAHEAIFLGAVGAPGVPDHVSLWGLLIPIRRTFEQYVNLRPIRVFPGVPSPLRDAGPEVDLIVVRENTEGEYSEIGGRFNRGEPGELAVQEAVFTR